MGGYGVYLGEEEKSTFSAFRVLRNLPLKTALPLGELVAQHKIFGRLINLLVPSR